MIQENIDEEDLTSIASIANDLTNAIVSTLKEPDKRWRVYTDGIYAYSSNNKREAFAFANYQCRFWKRRGKGFRLTIVSISDLKTRKTIRIPDKGKKPPVIGYLFFGRV